MGKLDESSLQKNQLPELPTWTYPEVKMYYAAQEANKRLQEMEQQFNRNRLQVKAFVQGMEKVIEDKDATIKLLLCNLDSKAVRIKELEDKIAEFIAGERVGPND